MAKDYDETVIRLDYESETAEIWTQRRGLISRLTKCGFRTIRTQGRGVWLTGPIKGVSFRKAGNLQGNLRTKAQLMALEKARAAKARS